MLCNLLLRIVNSHVSFGIFPVCLNYKSEKGCVYGDKCRFRHVEDYVKPNKKSKKSGAKGSVATVKESTQFGCVSQDSYPRTFIPCKPGMLGVERHRQYLQKKLAPYQNSRNKRVHREVLSQSVQLMSVVLARRNSRIDHMRRP